MPSNYKVEIVGVNEVIRNLENTMKQMRNAAQTALQISAAQAVVYAKQTAPWTDRTGDARRSIHSETSSDGMSVAIGIGEHYGKYLETGFGGRYRTIDPAVFSYGKAMFAKNLRSIL